MASNSLPRGLNELLTLGGRMVNGAQIHGEAIGLVHFTHEVLAPLVTTARSEDLAYAATRVARKDATEVQSAADAEARIFIGSASRVLGVHLGTKYSVSWEPTGFPNQSTAIPSTLAERVELLAQLQQYFIANPSHEAASVNVTAVRAMLKFAALSNAMNGVNQAIVTSAQKKIVRDTAVANLRAAMSGLIGELDLLLDDDDPKWYAFGLVPPANKDLCPPPENLILTPVGPGVVIADWSDTDRAVRYHVYVQIVGTDPDFVRFITVHDSDATLSGLPSGQTIKVRVTAINAADAEGPESEEAQIVVP